jgi:hypothetical protein
MAQVLRASENTGIVRGLGVDVRVSGSSPDLKSSELNRLN